MKIFAFSSLMLVSFACGTGREHNEALSATSIEQRLSSLSQQHAEAEAQDDLSTFINVYADDAISMPEYQLTLDGQKEIETYYAEIFQRQDVKSYDSRVQEFIHLDSTTVVEIGTFEKRFLSSGADLLTSLQGKYWHVWHLDERGNAALKGEAYGYFHPVENAPDLVVKMVEDQPDESDVYARREVPFELKAYNALMEKGVRKRDALLRASFFTDDGSFFPFADTTVTGMDKIKPYLIAYNSRGEVSIDAIQCYTYDFERVGDYILEYDMFKVRWRMVDFSGRTEGKGIRIWKRQHDGSLRLYREIATHNHIE